MQGLLLGNASQVGHLCSNVFVRAVTRFSEVSQLLQAIGDFFNRLTTPFVPQIGHGGQPLSIEFFLPTFGVTAAEVVHIAQQDLGNVCHPLLPDGVVFNLV